MTKFMGLLFTWPVCILCMSHAAAVLTIALHSDLGQNTCVTAGLVSQHCYSRMTDRRMLYCAGAQHTRIEALEWLSKCRHLSSPDCTTYCPSHRSSVRPSVSYCVFTVITSAPAQLTYSFTS